MGRLLCVLGLLLLAACSIAADALILIQHDRAGPNVRPGTFKFPQWILWPTESDAGSENGLLSIGTGEDRVGERDDLSFGSIRPLTWRSMNYRSLSRRGYPEAKMDGLGTDRITLVANPHKAVGPEALLIALMTDPVVHAIPFQAALPTTRFVVYEALGWGDARRMATRCHGRALVLEFPPSPGERWSRFWRFGSGWPSSDLVPTVRGDAIPGLIPISRVLQLLRDPSRFDWQPDRSRVWGGPDRWLDRDLRLSPAIRIFGFALAILAALVGIVRTAKEQRSTFERVLVRAALLFIAADVLAGNLATVFGLGAWLSLFIVSETLLLAFSGLIERVAKSWIATTHPLFGVCLVGACVMSVCSPTWSDFSGQLRWPVEVVPAIAVAAWIGYAVGTFTFLAGSNRRLTMLRRSAVLALAVWTCLFDPWWANGAASYVALALIPLAAAEDAGRGIFLVTVASLPTSVSRLFSGFAWKPGGLVQSGEPPNGVNLADWPGSIVSPLIMGCLLAGALAGFFASDFVRYRIRSLAREDRRRLCLFSAAIAVAAFGILNPTMLNAAGLLALGGVLVVVHDAVS